MFVYNRVDYSEAPSDRDIPEADINVKLDGLIVTGPSFGMWAAACLCCAVMWS